jgi:hypothetical protein
MTIKSSLALIIAYFIGISAYAGICNRPVSIDILKSNAGDSYIFYGYGTKNDFAFVIPGKSIDVSHKDAKDLEVIIDKIYYQIIRDPVSKYGQKTDDEPDQVLIAFKEKQASHIEQVTGSKVKVTTYCAERNDCASKSVKFRSWRFSFLQDGTESIQYYSVTKLDHEVVGILTTGETGSDMTPVEANLLDFIKSFRVLFSKKQCPELPQRQ